MNPFYTVPAGVRLDEWPESSPPPTPQDPPEVARLRAELRKSMPQFTLMFEMLAKLRPIQDLTARLAGPVQAQLITIRGSSSHGA